MRIPAKPWQSLLLTSAIAIAPAIASAKLLVYESFDYERRQWTEGTLHEPEGIDGLNGGFGFAGPWEETTQYMTGIAAEPQDFTDHDGLIAGARTQPLSYTDSQGRKLISTPGQARTSTSNSSYAVRKLAKPLGEPGETIWMSFLAQAATDAKTNFSFIELNENITTHYLRFGQGNATNTWGHDARSVDNQRIQSANGGSVINPVMFLVKIEVPTDLSDPVDVSYWFNPDLGSEASLGAPETFQTFHKQMNYLIVRGRISVDFDEIRIGTTFDSVTPYGDHSENLQISRATQIKFETDYGTTYQIQHSENGIDWLPMKNGTIEGTGSTVEIGYPESLSPDSIRVIIAGETYEPNTSSNRPLSITDGLALHLDAAATDTLSLNGLFVEEWRDAQGNDISFIPSPIDGLDTRPFYFSSGQGPNNRPAILFDESSLETFSPAGLSLMNDIDGVTFFSVVQNTQGGSQNILRISLPESLVGVRFVQYRTTSGYAAQFRRTAADTDPFSLAGGVRQSGVWSIDGTAIDYLAGTASLFLDGQVINHLSDIGNGPTDAVDALRVRIGSSTRNEMANPWQGGISEILFYNRTLTDDERNQVGMYLADKYNIRFNTVSDQPVPAEVSESISLSFAAETGEYYRVEWSNDLNGPWNDLGIDLYGAGLNERVYKTIEDGVDRRFFRLKKGF